ncbi:MAG: hypothetical protein RBS27_01435 [Giesbergeria sp.]|jgi:hypothetical protein|nr:hypothetical protein [Giesbergeria sp.]
MTLAPFAAINDMLNLSVSSALANATAQHNGGAAFGLLLDRTPTDPFGGAVSTAQLQVSFCVANAPGLVEGGELVINGVAHIVASPVEPDAGGWVTLPVYPKA